MWGKRAALVHETEDLKINCQPESNSLTSLVNTHPGDSRKKNPLHRPRVPPPVKMHHLLLLLLFLLLPHLAPASASAGSATYPYDIASAARIIQRECHANATNCCPFVFAAYMYAAVRYANSTATPSSLLPLPPRAPPHLPPPPPSSSAPLLPRPPLHPVQLLRPPLSPQFPTVPAILSAVNFSLAIHSCASGPRRDLYNNQSACTDCQNDVTGSTFALLNLTNRKDFMACDMAATIAIWNGNTHNITRFHSRFLCVIHNIGGLGTSPLLPFPPPPPPPMHPISPPPPSSSPSSLSSYRTVKIVSGSIAAAAFTAVD